MKKLLAIFLTLACLLGLSAMSVNADEPIDTLYKRFEDFYYDTRFIGFDEFEEGELDARSVHKYVIYCCRDGYKDYVVSAEDEYFATYHVPASVWEGLAGACFELSDTLINEMRASDEYSDVSYDSAQDLYIYEEGGGFGDVVEKHVAYFGYKPIENNVYEIYAYFYYTPVMGDPFVLSDSDIKGVDYIEVEELVNTYDENYNVIESHYETKQYEIIGGFKSKMKIDGENVKILSFAQCSFETLCKTEGIVSDYKIDLDENVRYDLPEGVTVEGDGSFPFGTKITCTKVESGDTYDNVTVKLADKADQFVVYEIEASKNAQPSAPIKVEFPIPEGFDGDLTVYYVSRWSDPTALETIVDRDTGMVTVELNHFSTYVLANVEKEEEPPVTEPPVTEAPVTEAPETEAPVTEPEETEPVETTAVETTIAETTPVEVTTESDDSDDKSSEPEPEKNDFPWYIIVAIVVIAAAAGAVIAFVVIKKKKNSAE